MTLPRQATLTGVTYYAYLTLEPEECDQLYDITIRVVDPDAQLAGTNELPSAPPVVNPFDGYGYMEIHAQLNVAVRSTGIYLVQLSLNDNVVAETRLQFSIES